MPVLLIALIADIRTCSLNASSSSSMPQWRNELTFGIDGRMLPPGASDSNLTFGYIQPSQYALPGYQSLQRGSCRHMSTAREQTYYKLHRQVCNNEVFSNGCPLQSNLV